jgi:hypothetical protein
VDGWMDGSGVRGGLVEIGEVLCDVSCGWQNTFGSTPSDDTSRIGISLVSIGPPAFDANMLVAA